MPNLENSGTQTASINTEHTLFTSADNKAFTSYIDLSNMTDGDIVEIRIKVKIKSGGSAILFLKDTLRHVQDQPLWHAPLVPSDLQYDLTLKQTGGTGRVFDWRVLSP
jgi:hypothetical protein